MRCNLAIIPYFSGSVTADGAYLPEKAVEGVRMFASLWTLGDVEVLLHRTSVMRGQLDNRFWTNDELPCAFRNIDLSELEAMAESQGARTVFLMGPDHLLRQATMRFIEAKIPYVLVTELSLRTRIRIAWTNRPSYWKFAKQLVWLLLDENSNRAIYKNASGMQCNGTPTYESYRRENSRRLLFFDSRIRERMLPTPAEVESKYAELIAGHRPLRLLFSGRLTAIKGVDDLLDIAIHLRDLDMSYEMYIAGDGDRLEDLTRRTREAGLSDQVKFLGVMDFKEELVPFLKENIDVFLCTHKQGDPSCTYVETMCTGVPIIGYDNEAFMGICAASDSGWVVKTGQTRKLAEKLVELGNRPQRIVDSALKAIEFGRQHTFKKEFERRVRQLQEIAKKSDAA